MKAPRTWVLIADGARARIARCDGRGRGLRPAFDHEFVGRRAPTRRMMSDRSGRVVDAGSGGSHAVGPHFDRHDYEQRLFLRDVAIIVSRAAERRKFDRLVVVAPPAALGMLRQVMRPGARDRVAAEVSKDLTNLPLREVSQRLLSVSVL